MKRFKALSFILLVSTVFIAGSCSDSNSVPVIEPNCKLMSFAIHGTYYDEIKNGYFAYNPSFTGRINLNYENEVLTLIKGGLMNLSLPGTLNVSFSQSDDVQDTVAYSGDVITVNSYHLYTKDFVIVNGQLVSQNTTYNSYLPFQTIEDYSPGLHTYEYVGDTILEKVGTFTRRIFYIENGNLVKIDWFFKNSQNVIYMKKEYLFSNYDTTPNLLKGKFYVNGSFFKAFSNNNYRKLEMNTYDAINGVYVLNQGQYAYFAFGDLPSDMFVQDCQ